MAVQTDHKNTMIQKFIESVLQYSNNTTTPLFYLYVICKEREITKDTKCVRNVSGQHDCAKKHSANTIQVRK